MPIKVVYIDDKVQDLLKYKAKFAIDSRAREKFVIEPINTPKSRGDYDRISKANPELLLIDYYLDIPDENNEVIGISGVTMSTELRKRFSEVPIVLFTRKSVFRIQDYTKIKETLCSIDEIVYKQDVFKADSSILEELYKLSAGYKTLRNQSSRSWDALMKVLGASQSDLELLEQAEPPVNYRKGWAAASMASWIRNIVLEFPGILYDRVHASTLLGISKDVFQSDNVQEIFVPAKYKGIFEPHDRRWWKSKLLNIAYSIMNKKERELSLGDGFPTALERRKVIAIERAKCIFSGEFPADWVCHILKKPVMIKYSLSYKADNRPAVMDEARVSFEAIRTSNDFDERCVGLLGRELIPDIRKMPKPAESVSAD